MITPKSLTCAIYTTVILTFICVTLFGIVASAHAETYTDQTLCNFNCSKGQCIGNIASGFSCPACTLDSHCGTGFLCQNNSCVADPAYGDAPIIGSGTSGSCSSSSDCSPYYLCQSGTCVMDPAYGDAPVVGAGSGGNINSTGGNTNSTGGNSNSTGSNVNTGQTTGSKSLVNPIKCTSQATAEGKCLTEFLLKIIDVILVFALPIIVFFIMYAGFMYVTAAGETGKIATAHTALTWAVIGGVIVLGAKLIMSVIQNTITAF